MYLVWSVGDADVEPGEIHAYYVSEEDVETVCAGVSLDSFCDFGCHSGV